MCIENGFKKVMVKVGASKVKRKSSILKEILNNPENVKLEAYIENDEFVVKVKRKEVQEES